MNLSSAAIVDFLLGAVVFFATFFADRRDGEGKKTSRGQWLNFTLIFRLAGITLMILALWRIVSGRG